MPFEKGHTINVGRKRSEKTKKLMSLSKMGEKNPMYGMRGDKNPSCRPEVREKIKQKTILQFKNGMPIETKLKLSKIHTGMKHSEETKKKISKNHRKFQTKNTIKKIVATRRKNKSYFHTNETKKIISEKRRFQILPLKDTKIEKMIQLELKKRNIKFKTHVPLLGQPDIFIKPNICIFADGDYWHNYPNGRKKDKKITKILNDEGYKVFRFWEREIHKDVKKCINQVFA